MIRVIAGSARSLKLMTPPGEHTRPTQDRIRETIFNILQDDVPGSVFLDLFSGSGAIGIEALSRGASHAYFIENSKEALSCIRENLAHTHLEKGATVLAGDVFSQLYSVHEKAVDLVYIDPPYEGGTEERVFACLLNQDYINEDTLIILEADLKHDFLFEGFRLVREKHYKTNKHLFYRKEGA